MGCPSTAIGVEELARAGARTFIRVGSSAALQPHRRGRTDRVRGLAAQRRDDGGLRARRVPRRSRPRAHRSPSPGPPGGWARSAGSLVQTGINVTSDAFYAETPELVSQLSALGVTDLETESSAMYVVARLRGLRAGMVCAVSGNHRRGPGDGDRPGPLTRRWRGSSISRRGRRPARRTGHRCGRAPRWGGRRPRCSRAPRRRAAPEGSAVRPARPARRARRRTPRRPVPR